MSWVNGWRCFYDSVTFRGVGAFLMASRWEWLDVALVWAPSAGLMLGAVCPSSVFALTQAMVVSMLP